MALIFTIFEQLKIMRVTKL